MYNLDFVNSCYANYASKPVDTEVSPNDLMNNQWYFEVGRSAVEVILAGLMSSYTSSVSRVLDLPCGHGRVLRHLVRLFPDAQFHACDLDADGVSYCAERFSAIPVLSRIEPAELDFDVEFDLIWVGSLFTHLDARRTALWMARLARFLSPSGIVVATVHGRWSETVHKRAPYIGPERWDEILAGYRSAGYGYSDYIIEESSNRVSGSYGISMAMPHAIMRILEGIGGIRVYTYNERAWADHQDVIVYGRPAHDTPWD